MAKKINLFLAALVTALSFSGCAHAQSPRSEGGAAQGMRSETILLPRPSVYFGFGYKQQSGDREIVTSVAPGSPAAEAGLAVGDVFLAVNGRDVLDGRGVPRRCAGTQVHAAGEARRGGARPHHRGRVATETLMGTRGALAALWMLPGLRHAGYVMRSLARLLVLGALLASPLAAQPAAQLSGTVTQPGSTPVAGARVQVTVQTGQSFETHTDTAGRYQIRLPAGSGGLVVSVEAPGLRPATRLLSDPHRTAAALTLDFALELPAVKLDRLVVRAPRLSVAEATRWTPGSAEQASTGMGLRQNPLATGDASELAARKVGVAQSATADGVGLSIAGQAPDQTRLSMDGAGIDGVVIPREAIGAVSVTGNAYDVARGRYTGGQVDVQTQRAGNPWGATLRLDGSDRRLQYGDAPESFRRRSSHLGLDAGGGGALVRDRLFAYGALTLRQTESPTFSLGSLDARELGELGISADSVARFLGADAADAAGAGPTLRPGLGPRLRATPLGCGAIRPGTP